MRISSEHRSITQPVPPETYRKAADDFVLGASKTKLFDAIVVCGSLVKNDIISGWSDLDIVCIAKTHAPRARTLTATARICDQLTNLHSIGIGLDLTWRDEFDRTSRIGGRPLAMTYEVAQYGEFHINRSPFSTAQPEGALHTTLQRERIPLALAELHNWRRVAMQTPHPDRTSAALSIKTLLKLLKISVAPYAGHRFTHQEDLAFLPEGLPHEIREAFTMAVNARLNWPSVNQPRTATARRLFSLLAKFDALNLLDALAQ